MTTHSLENAVGSADNLYILWNGRLVFSGTPNELGVESLPEEVRYWLGSVVVADRIVRDGGLCYAEVNGFRIHVTYRAG